MQALRSRRWLFTVVALASLCAPSCGWQTTMNFRSPSGKSSIEIWQRRVISSAGARVELITAGRRVTLQTADRDTSIYLVHVYWAPDESKVGVVVTGLVFLEVAADLKTGATIPFELIREDAAKSIRKTSQVPPRWMTPFGGWM